MSSADRERRAGLAATLAPLGEVESALAWLASSGFEAVQLSAAQPGMRPRELDSGARRALEARLRQLELAVSGVDLWIPPAHFERAEEADRAVGAFFDAIGFCEDLGRPAISCSLPDADRAPEVRRSLLREADRRGVRLVDFSCGAKCEGPVAVGIDMAALMSGGGSILEAIVRAGDSLGAIRLARMTPSGARAPFVAAGEGFAALVELRSALSLGGFRGVPVVDARAWPDPRAGLLATCHAWAHAASVEEGAL